jgi:hypothetical protein
MTPEELKKQEILGNLSFEFSPVWNSVMDLLDTQIEMENQIAVSRNTVGEARIHACGAVDGLAGFKTYLLDLHDMARSSPKSK